MDLKEESILGEMVSEHWYYHSKSQALIHFIGPEPIQIILDIGAGSGFFSKELLRRTTAGKAICVDTSYASDLNDQTLSKTIFFCQNCNSTNADLVLLMDVLEHVDDDLGLLKGYIEKVPVGARFLITVPAFQCMWSGHDDFLEHKRRYTLKQVKCLIESSGLHVERGAYFFGLIFPIVAFIRVLGNIMKKSDRTPQSDLKLHSKTINAILKLLCTIELPFFRFNQFVGLTVFCLARKL